MNSYDLGSILAGFLINGIVGLLSYLKSRNNEKKLEVLTVQTNGISAALAEKNAAVLKITSDAQLEKGKLIGAAEERANPK
jgi:hypothetical protein